MNKPVLLATLAVGLTTGAAVLMPASAQAFTFSFDSTSISSNSSATGASALVDFSFSDVESGIVQLDFTITNTTDVTDFGAGATESKLTGFGFDLLDGLSVVNNSFTNTGYLDTFLTDVSFNPFPSLDVAFADNGNFLGGGPNGALAQGQTTTASIQLSLSGAGNAAQLENAFFTALSEGSMNIGARFQAVNAGSGSDKLLGGTIDGGDDDIVEVPEPGALAGFGLIAGLVVSNRRRR
jgi:hypothetical protein